jgi:hypothetical protein
MRIRDYIYYTLALAVVKVYPDAYAKKVLPERQAWVLFSGCYVKINHLLDTLTDKLSLGFEQRAAINTILTHKAIQIASLYQRTDFTETIRKSKLRKISQSAVAKIKSVLMPEQSSAFDHIAYANSDNNTLRV